ncbi:MAG: hypothetical protein ACI4V3_01915 [Faecousia sp.]
MGMLSLLSAVGGIVTTLVHYSNHSIVLGIISAVLLVVSFVLGTVDMKKQEKNGGVKVEMFNPALLGHGISSVILIVCGIMCLLSNLG